MEQGRGETVEKSPLIGAFVSLLPSSIESRVSELQACTKNDVGTSTRVTDPSNIHHGLGVASRSTTSAFFLWSSTLIQLSDPDLTEPLDEPPEPSSPSAEPDVGGFLRAAAKAAGASSGASEPDDEAETLRDMEAEAPSCPASLRGRPTWLDCLDMPNDEVGVTAPLWLPASDAGFGVAAPDIVVGVLERPPRAAASAALLSATSRLRSSSSFLSLLNSFSNRRPNTWM